jgi:CzcA family heavy metal efflux pump
VRSLLAWSQKTKALILGLALIVLGFGIHKVFQHGMEVLPELSATTVEIQTEALGLSATEVEQMITVPLEADLLNGVPWLKNIRSNSIDGLSSIQLIFDPGTDVMNARQMVQERLTQAHALPQVSKPPLMLPPLSSASRIMAIAMSSKELSPIQLSVLAHWIVRPRLMGVPGVANVSIWGERNRELQVQVDPKHLRQDSVTLQDVIRSAGEALWESPLSYLEASTPGTGGWIDTPNQRLGIRHVLPIETADDLAKVAFKDAKGTVRKLGDVTTVVEDHQPLIGDAIVDGNPGLVLVVEKFPMGDTQEITRDVDNALTALEPGLPGVTIDKNVFRSDSFLAVATDNLSRIALVASLCAIVLLLLVFREWRAVVIGIVAIGLSLSAAIAVLFFFGMSINGMVLAGLLIALAAVVDDAVTDIGTILARIREHYASGGTGSTLAVIIDASLEARSPVVYATVIMILAAIPLLFVSGFAGAFFSPLVTAYSAALLASMVVAVLVTPILCTLLLGTGRIGHTASKAGDRVRQGYGRMLSGLVGRPVPAYAAAAAMTVAVLLCLPFVGTSLLPEFAERDLVMHWTTAPGTSLTEMRRITGRVMSDLKAVPGVQKVTATLGRAIESSELFTGPDQGVLWIDIRPDADLNQVREAVRDVASQYPGIDNHVLSEIDDTLRQKSADEPADSITVRIYGEDDKVLQDKAAEVAQLAKTIPGVEAVRTHPLLQTPAIEIETDLGRAQQHGIKPGDVRRATSTVLSGIQVGGLFQDQKIFDVVVWGKPDVRESLSSIRDLAIDTPDGGSVRLGDVAQVSVKPSDVIIKRDAVSRYADVDIDVKDRNQASVKTDLKQALAQVKLPLEYHFQLQGDAPAWRGAKWQLMASIIAAGALIFLLLQAALSSWSLAALVFLTLPAALVGGLVVIGFSGGSSLVALAGLLAVLGIAVRNGVDILRHVQRLAIAGQSGTSTETMVRGATERVVPILSSALVTAGALLPFALSHDVAGLELVQSLAVIILGGIVGATVFMLLIFPVMCANVGFAAEPDPTLE